MTYDPVARHEAIARNVIQKKVGGDLRKYYHFRHDRWHGGTITADCAGCGLACKFCWARSEAELEGREKGDWLGPGKVVDRLLELCRKHSVYQLRLSGGEPTLAREHLFGVLKALQRKRVRFILETNGILLGSDETYAQDLALYPFVHVRVSLKGCNEEEFALLTGADPKGFQIQMAALKNLVEAGVSVHPAVMSSFSTKEGLDLLYHKIWKINPIMHSEVEREEVVLYPHVAERLARANLKHRSGHIPDRPPPADR